MKTIKLLGLAIMATAAFSIVGAISGVGSAAALLFLTTNGVANELFTLAPLNSVPNLPVIIENQEKDFIECGHVEGHGFILNKTDVAEKILLTFSSCFAGGIDICKSGNEEGIIKSLELDGLLVSLLNEHYGLLILGETSNHIASATCAGAIDLVVTGNVVGEFTESKAASEAFKAEAKIEFKKGKLAGEPWIKDYWTLQKIVAPKLEARIGALTSEASLLAIGDIKPVKPIKFCHT